MLEVLNFSFKKELLEIKNSYYKLFLITLFPILSFAFVIAIFYKGVATKLPIVVVDKDKSELSRALLFNLNASSTLDISYSVNSSKEAIELIQTSKAYAFIEISKNFEKDVLLQKKPQVTLMLNTQYILIAKIIKGAVFETVAYSTGEVEYFKNLLKGENGIQSLRNVTPIALQITPFFNTYKNYFLFLISALIPAIWQIFIVISTVVSFGTLVKDKEDEEFYSGGFLSSKILGKLLPYTFVYTLLGIGFLFFIYGTEGWVFHGSFALIVLGLFLTVIAYQAVSLLFFVISFNYARTLSLGAVYTAPAFAFLGVTFPVGSMNEFALFWRDLLPISHYIELQISQANYGADIYLDAVKLLSLLAFSLLFIPIYLRFKQRYTK